jgi:hypothetical protein
MLLSVLALCFSSSAAAQAPLPVYVSFEFHEPSIAGKLSDAARESRQKEMSVRLAAKLFSRYPFWSFQNGGATDYPRLNLWLEKHSQDEWQMHLNLVIQQALPEVSGWQVQLYPPGEIARRGFPSTAQLLDEIGKKFEDYLGSQSSNDILEKLELGAPLSMDIAPLPVSAQSSQRALAVLPLQWDKFCSLSSSEFTITVRLTDGRASINSKATGEAADYKPDNPQFQGLQIEHIEWIPQTGLPERISGHLQQLGQLTHAVVRIKRFTLDPTSCQSVSLVQ